MAPRLGGQRAAVLQRVARGLNRVDDAPVARAAADVAVERLRDRLAIAGLALLNQRRRPDDNAGNAEAALDAAFKDERFADDAPHLLGHPLERGDLVAGHLLRLPQARQRRTAVDVD